MAALPKLPLIPKNFRVAAREEVAEWVKAGNVCVVDVRESDFEGGRTFDGDVYDIRESVHAPFKQLEAQLNDIKAAAHGKQHVVFVCMYGKLRGPSAALTFMRAASQDEADRVYVLSEGMRSFMRKYAQDAEVVAEFDASKWTPEGEYADDADIASVRSART